jgi:hypothetical protein
MLVRRYRPPDPAVIPICVTGYAVDDACGDTNEMAPVCVTGYAVDDACGDTNRF